MYIRRGLSKDIDDLLRLLHEVNSVHHVIRPDLFKGNTTKYDAREISEILRNEDEPIFVCVEGDRVLGYIFCKTEITEESPLRKGIKTLYIDDLCVDEPFRKKHVGGMLYQHALDYARENGFYNVTLHVWGGNEGALQFYRKMGMSDQYVCMEQVL